jgi:hypothetical protein
MLLGDLETLVQLQLQLEGGVFTKAAAVNYHSARVNLCDLSRDKHVSDEEAEAESEVAKSEAFSEVSGTVCLVNPDLNVHIGETSHNRVKDGDLKTAVRFYL